VQPGAAAVIPSLSGGWIEIGRPTPGALLDMWHRKHRYDPVNDLGRAVEPGDLVSTVVIHAPGGSTLTPIGWDYETQRRFAHFLASIARMTFAFPQQAAFSDPAGRLSIHAEAYKCVFEPRHRRIHVRFHTQVVSPLRDGTFETDLYLHQGALATVVSSCCAVFPALGPDDYWEAWN
jgi:hypothetical protein